MPGQKSSSHYLGKSRQVFEISDKEKLYKLLAEQKVDLMKQSIGFGKSRGTVGMNGNKPASDKKAINNIRKNIARIQTRLSQLRQMEMKS